MKPTRRRHPQKISRVLEKLASYRPLRVYVFGSYARGEQDSLSDVDLVIIKNTETPFLERTREVLRCLRDEGAFDIFVYTPAEFEEMKASRNAFIEMLLDEGVCVYDAQEAA